MADGPDTSAVALGTTEAIQSQEADTLAVTASRDAHHSGEPSADVPLSREQDNVDADPTHNPEPEPEPPLEAEEPREDAAKTDAVSRGPMPGIPKFEAVKGNKLFQKFLAQGKGQSQPEDSGNVDQ